RHLVHTFLSRHAGGVGAVGELVGVITQPRDLAQQVGMVGAGARVKFCAHDQTSDIRLTGQTAQINLPVEVTQFLIIEAQRDLVLPFTPDSQRTTSYRGCLGGYNEVRCCGTSSRSSSVQSGR